MTDPAPLDVRPADASTWTVARGVGQVLAWHRRHPLARRLGVHEVAGLGLVALPYGPGGSGMVGPLFHEPALLPGLSHRELVAFADRHAVPVRPGADDWPVRVVERADASLEPPPETRYLLTAAIRDARAGATVPRRVLIAPGSPAVWGPRQFSRVRIGAALGGVVLLIALATAWMWWKRLPDVAPPVASVSAAASAPRPAASMAAVSPAPAGVAPTVAVPSAAPASVLAPAASAPASAPPPPPLASRPAMSMPPTPAAALAHPAATAPPVVPMPALRAPAGLASAPALSAAPSRHYALVSPPEKKRAAAEATLVRLRHTLGPAIGDLQTQVMPTPQGFVVTLWPLTTQADAERMAAVLERRRLPMKWMEF
jgi:hypothetical protein